MKSIFEFMPMRGQHMNVFGQNGMGKSYFIDRVSIARMWSAPSIVALDTKNDPENYQYGWTKYTTLEQVKEAGARSERAIVYSPDPTTEGPDPYFHNEFFKWVYLRENTVVPVDEVLAVTFRQELPDYMRACLTRGRALGISVVMGSQWPKNVPTAVLSEAKLTVVFFLALDSHRRRVAEWVPIDPDAIAELEPRQFYFHRQGMKQATGPHILAPPQQEVAAV